MPGRGWLPLLPRADLPQHPRRPWGRQTAVDLIEAVGDFATGINRNVMEKVSPVLSKQCADTQGELWSVGRGDCEFPQ